MFCNLVYHIVNPPGALMEYAAILLLLKKRRRPVRSVNEGLKSVLAIVQAGTENGEANPQRPQRRKVVT